MKTNIALVAILMLLICTTQIAYGQTSNDIDFDYLNQVAAATNHLNQNAHEKPCTLYDDDQWYRRYHRNPRRAGTAFNEKLGVEGDPQLANTLLRTCQQQLKDKLAGRVQGITTSYFDQMDIDGNSTAAEHIEGATQLAVDQLINETQEYCRRERPAIYEKGKIILYMSIRVKKTDILAAMEEAMQSDSESKVRYNEQKFREAAFKVFNEDNAQQ